MWCCARGVTRFELVTPVGAVESAVAADGRVNVYNLLAAACAALARGLTLDEIAAACGDVAAGAGTV